MYKNTKFDYEMIEPELNFCFFLNIVSYTRNPSSPSTLRELIFQHAVGSVDEILLLMITSSLLIVHHLFFEQIVALIPYANIQSIDSMHLPCCFIVES